MTGRRIVVGVGNRDRGDDAVGPVVCDRIRQLGAPVEVWVVEADPTTLAVRWTPDDEVVVIDAAVTGAPPGTVHALGPDQLAAAHPVSSHGLGVAETIALSVALGTTPRNLSIVAVEAAGFDHGAGLSAPVTGAVDRIVAQLAGSATRVGTRHTM